MPTIEEIESVWDVPEDPDPPGEQPLMDDYLAKEELKHQYNDDMNAWKAEVAQFKVDQANYERKVEVLLWFVDKFLPLVVGLECWRADLRRDYLLTDKIIFPGDKSKKEKVLVTSSSEAFGVLVHKNCRTKWLNVHAWKKKHGDKPNPPDYDPEDETTHKCHAIWSTSRSGSGDGGGWDMQAHECCEAKKAEIVAWRAADNADHKKMVVFANDLIKEANQDLVDNRKRAAAAAEVKETAPARKVVKITYSDE